VREEALNGEKGRREGRTGIVKKEVTKEER
jgi:hypothetical protein